jgi:methionyl-tRNA formyltransferase
MLPALGVPGQVVGLVKGEGFLIKAGKGTVLITEVQPAGKRRMSASEFMAGNKLQVGEIFGVDSGQHI